MNEPRHTPKMFSSSLNTDADWSKATVTVKVPINGTAETTVQEVEVPLLTFAGLLTWTKAQLVDLLGYENTPKHLAGRQGSRHRES